MLTKQSININFAQGLDTKTDPWQVQAGRFLQLQNTVFNKGGLLSKRNGFGSLSALPNSDYSYITTLSDSLIAIGNEISVLNPSNATWGSAGQTYPLTLSTLPLVRNNLNQIQCDAAVASNGLVCTVYSEKNNQTTVYKYAIANATTGQNIIAPTVIPVGSGTVTGSPRVFVLGIYFVIIFTNVISGTSHLQFVAVSSLNPVSVTANANIASAYIPYQGLAFDAVYVSSVGNLYVSWNTTTGGQAIKTTYITPSLQVATPATTTGVVGQFVAMCVDIYSNTTPGVTPVIWCATYDNVGQTGYVFAFDPFLNGALNATEYQSGASYSNLTIAANRGVCTTYLETPAAYGYDSSIPTHYIIATPVTEGGTVEAVKVVIRSVGLASKAFIVNGNIYFLAAYQSPFQPTYFLINASQSSQTSPVIVAKLAYENGGGYLTYGLPNVSFTASSTVSIPYLYKDLIQALNTTGNSQQTTAGGIYSQTGINLATFDFTSADIDSAEIAGSLHLTGGYLSMYDGLSPVEHNFFLWPDSVEAIYTANSVKTPTGTASNGSNSIVVSSATGVYPGMTIADTTNATYIPAGTTILAVNGTTVTMSANATHAISGDSLSIQGNIAAQPDGSTNTNAYYYQAVYEWSDNNGNIYRSAPSIPISVTTSGTAATGIIQLNVPYLRLTQKVSNPVKLVIYRWSVKNEVYYQVTSITAPVMNFLGSADYAIFVDTLPDSSIVGNNILYTTGGVLEDVNAPASNIVTLFDTRLWLVDAEDPNLLWFSKQVIENTPVEMSDLLTFYVAPTQGAQGSTGPITALAPMDDKLIIFKSDAIYYINGTGPDNTGSNSQYPGPIFITSTVGCSNQKSIVFMPGGLMFQSDKGIWILGRDLSTNYIGAPVEAFNSSTVQSTVGVPGTNQVRFTLDTGQQLMYDYYYQQWGTFVGVGAISSCIFENLHTIINSYGDVFQETPGEYIDGTEPVLISFMTSWLNLMGIQGYQRAYFFYLLGEYLSPHKLQVTVAYDYEAGPAQTSLIQPVNFGPAYGNSSPYGQGTYGGSSNVEQWRVFLSRQRCQSVQVGIQEIYDPTLGVAAGAGLTLSGLNMVLAAKKNFRSQSAATSIGSNTV
jgi:hypothetical protein